VRTSALLLTFLFPAALLAQDAGDMATARALGTEGLRLAEAGNCAEAVERLARAEKLFHAPTTLERLGECQVKLGRIVEGTESLRRVARERLPEGAPSAFARAQARAAEALEAALPHLARLRVEVIGASGTDVVLKIDGQAVSSASIGVERPIDPGAHVIEASATGFKNVQSHVQVGEGSSQSTSLTLERDPTFHPPVVHHELEQLPPPPKTTTHRVYWPAAVAFGVAGAGLIVGSVFGITAIVDKNNLQSTCGGDACNPAQRGQFSDLTTFASLSNLGFIAFGAAAVAGVVLVAIAPKRVVVESASLTLTPRGVAIVGTF
jgi:hypothetical protein